MCEFCVQHGEGKKWYLEAKNYSQDLLSDARRQKEILAMAAAAPQGEKYAKTLDDQLDRLDRLPDVIRRVIDWRVGSQQKRRHFGQVLPIEDVERVFGLVNSITRIGCMCRKMVLGTEQRYCYAISTAGDGDKLKELMRQGTGYDAGVVAGDQERLTKEETLAAFRDHERESLCHTVWTMGTPFIFAVCNCDRGECLAMRSTVTHNMRMFFRGEYVAEVNPDACNGCRACMRACQFGALNYSAATKKALVQPRSCYGCGTCRALCAKNAIALRDRASVPVAAKLW
jgi:ferredoxin